MIVGEHVLPEKRWNPNVFMLQLIVDEILLLKIGPLLEDHNLESGGGKLFGDNSSSAAGAHDYKIHCGFVLEFSHGVALHRPLYSLS